MDPTTTNNTASEDTTVNCPVDLSITKSDSPDPVTAGSTLTYTLTITNNGPNNATGVMVTDTLPAGVTLVSATPSQGTCTEVGGTVTCDLGNLAIGAGATITIEVAVDPATPCVSIINSASVAGNEFDPNTGDNTASEDTIVNCLVDLSITKSDSPDPVTAGDNLTYTLTITNNGPSDATGVMVTDILPTGITLSSVTPSQGICIGSVNCDLGNLANGASATITIEVIVPPATPSGTITNSASVAGNETDPNIADNTSSEGTTVIGLADLSITKSDSPDPVTAGDILTYTLSVTNNGPGDATGVTITDTLPTGVMFTSATSGCTEAGGTVTCSLGNLANGASVTITIEVSTDPTHPGGTVTNTASVAGNEMDLNTGDNNASEDTTVRFLVQIDISPGDTNNIINPTSKGRVSVAILSTPGFDAPNAVDQSTLTFGRTGNEASLFACKSLARDVNGDGLLDLIYGFYIQLTDFQIGDTEGILRGETMAGVPFEGRDSVMVVLPRPRR